jgi:hypothetical protein
MAEEINDTVEATMTSALNTVAQWWRNWTAARANVASLHCCGADETARMAHDLGVTTPELRALAGKWPDSADLLNDRLAALDLDRAEIQHVEPRVLADLQRVCTMCTKRACKHDLAQRPDDPVWREYCPNVGTLDALAAERKERARQATQARRRKAVIGYLKTLER